MKRNGGFTLFEVLIAVAIVFIVILALVFLGVLVRGGCFVAKHGFRPVAERVWNGEDNQVVISPTPFIPMK